MNRIELGIVGLHGEIAGLREMVRDVRGEI